MKKKLKETTQGQSTIKTESNSLLKNLQPEFTSEITIPNILVYDLIDPEMEENGFVKPFKASISFIQKHSETIREIIVIENAIIERSDSINKKLGL